MKKKRIVTALCAGGLLAVILLARSGTEKALEVEVATVTRGNISESIPAGGKIFPVREVEIAAEVSGEIVLLPVSEGDLVKRGDILLKIRQDTYIAALESARASLGMLKAELRQQESRAAQAGAELERVRILQSGDAVPMSRLESAEAENAIAEGQLEAARYAVERGEAAVREAEDNLARTVIRAPMQGNVSRLAVKVGERIVGTSQMAGTPVMRITDFSEMELVVNVGENDVVKIHERDSAEVSLEAYGKRKFSAVVTKIANSAKFVDGSFGQVTNFEVRIAMLPESYSDLLKREPFPIRPGMSATAAIRTGEVRGILKIPSQSLFTAKGEERVWKVEGGRAISVKVETGLQDLDFIEAAGAIKEGDLVVTAPGSAINGTLADGAKVKTLN